MNTLLTPHVNIIVDVVAVVVLIVFAIIGYKNGFVKTFFSAFGTILALLLAVLLASTVASFLSNKFNLVDTIGGWLSGVLNGIFGEKVMNTTLGNATTELLSEYNIAGFLIDIILSSKADTTIPLDTTLSQIIIPTFSYYVLLILCVIALFIIFKIVFYLLSALAKSLHKFMIFGLVDKILGLALNLISGAISLQLAMMVIGIIPLPIFNDINVAIHSSFICSFISYINLYNLIINVINRVNIVNIIKSTIGI